MLQNGEVLVRMISNTSPWFQIAQFVREEVFIVEQQIPADREMDHIDALSLHWIAYRIWTQDQLDNLKHEQPEQPAPTILRIEYKGDVYLCEPMATLRLFYAAIANEEEARMMAEERQTLLFRMGRVATRKCFRGTGVGKLVVLQSEQDLISDGGKVLRQLISLAGADPDRLQVKDMRVQMDLHSQYTVIPFYERNGYIGERDPVDANKFLTFMEDGILHANMSKIIKY